MWRTVWWMLGNETRMGYRSIDVPKLHHTVKKKCNQTPMKCWSFQQGLSLSLRVPTWSNACMHVWEDVQLYGRTMPPPPPLAKTLQREQMQQLTRNVLYFDQWRNSIEAVGGTKPNSHFLHLIYQFVPTLSAEWTSSVFQWSHRQWAKRDGR